MTRQDEARQRRAAERASWTGKITTLAELPEVERLPGAPEALIGLVYELTLAAWAMRGARIPDYARDAMPGRVIRPSPEVP